MPRSPRVSMEMMETFIAIIDCDGDAARAAKMLRINQPSMSKRLAFLKQAGPALPNPWVSRSGKTWIITQEGRRVLPAVEEIVRRYEKLGDFLDGVGSKCPEVRVACGSQMVDDFLFNTVIDFKRQYPEVRLRIATMNSFVRIEGVANGLLDMALVTQTPTEIQAIARQPVAFDLLSEEPMALALSQQAQPSLQEHFADLPTRDLNAIQLTTIPLIFPEPDSQSRRHLDQVFKQAGVLEQLQIVLELDNWPAVIRYLLAGLGAVILPRRLGLRLTGLLPLRLLDPVEFPTQKLKLICRSQPGDQREPDLSIPARQFRDNLLNCFRGNEATLLADPILTE